MKVGCPPLGRYTKVIKRIGEYLGWDFIVPPSISERTIETGSKYLNELMCLPAKTTLGSMIEMCEQGATELIMFDSCGKCRLTTYWILQEQALRRLGYSVTVHPVRLGWRTPGDIRAIDPSISYWRAWLTFIRVLREVMRLDKTLWTEIPEESNLPKIGLVGEIYSILAPEINKNLIQKIERMGVLVHNSLPLSYFIFKGFYNRGWMKRRGIDRRTFLVARKCAHEYFPKEIGGHGKESIIHTIYYALNKFDGVLHVMPFPCSPEAAVATVIDNISRDYGIPVMRLIFDAQTGEAGLVTRLEAFVDMVRGKKSGKRIGFGERQPLAEVKCEGCIYT